ncbi:ABC-2 type transport system permease protein/lipopolysaccharide transport system permease protein [Maricaulis maris]|uniref:ABC-2 type transport system permease protein/lipopolysaccharide transport system permease protein n=2 Tax=Maricaulaceae TaxID=2800061 RepID=A0A495D5U5_9PROT|nr:ABC-2 type transport system permease protein/lipopolysaccharide transport system permease protein [Maricaulis maris]
MVELWRTFAWDEIQQRYRRSMLGVSWIVLSFLMFVCGVSFFFSALSGREMENFIVYVALGYAAFIFISGNFLDGCQVFTSSRVWIKAMSLPYSVHVYRSLFRSFVTFSLQMAVVFPIMIWSGWTPGLITLMAIPALAIYVLNAIAAQYLLGLIAARFEDAGHLVASITRLLIFVTPILWVREGLDGARAFAADLNPLTHYVEIFRAPFLGEMPRMTSWLVVFGVTVAVWVAAALSAAIFRRRLPYWL